MAKPNSLMAKFITARTVDL